jgi:hypothetical protein
MGDVFKYTIPDLEDEITKIRNLLDSDLPETWASESRYEMTVTNPAGKTMTAAVAVSTQSNTPYITSGETIIHTIPDWTENEVKTAFERQLLYRLHTNDVKGRVIDPHSELEERVESVTRKTDSRQEVIENFDEQVQDILSCIHTEDMEPLKHAYNSFAQQTMEENNS